MPLSSHWKRPARVILAGLLWGIFPMVAMAQATEPATGGTLTGLPGADGTLGGLLATVAALLAKAEWDRRRTPPQPAKGPDTSPQLARLEERTEGLRRDLDALRSDTRDAIADARRESADRLDRLADDLRTALGD